jgi:hypothetical protein
MDALIQVLRYEVWGLLITLAVVVAYELITGGVKTEGLLYDKAPTGRERARVPPALLRRGERRERVPGELSPARVQLLIFTVAGALYYLMLVFKADRPGEFPEIPAWLLLGLGGSHAFYLGGKLSSLLSRVFGARGGRE